MSTTHRHVASPLREHALKPFLAMLLAAPALGMALPVSTDNDLPKATYVETVISNIDTAVAPDRATNRDIYAPETVEYAINPYPGVYLAGYARTWAGASPGLEAHVDASRLSDRSVIASGHIAYYTRLDGLPYGTPVPMHMLYSGWSVASGGVGGGGGIISLESGTQRYLDELQTWTPAGTTSASMAGSFDFDMRAGVAYRVELYGVAQSVGGSATVHLDPTFQFGAGVDTRGLTISFSDGIQFASAVPEPASAVLLALGVVGLALRHRRNAVLAATSA